MPAKNILIIGGGVLGPKVACRLKRLQPHWEVTVVDQQEDIAPSVCGIPCYLCGEVAELKDLTTASFHMVRSPDFFENAKGVHIKTRTQALSVDRQARRVRIRHLNDGLEADIPYDTLVLATGRRPKALAVPGADLPGVTRVATLKQAQAVRELVSQGRVGKAVVVGGGPNGCELAAAMIDLWGVETTLMEPGPRLLPDRLDPPLAAMALHTLKQNGVEVISGEGIQEIRAASGDGALEVVTAHRRLPANLVIVALGAEPDNALASQAGLAVAPGGGIVVDQRLMTSDPNIYAGGGCAASLNALTGKAVYFPEDSLAHRQGRVLGTNIAGGFATFPGIVGSFAFKIFDLGVAGAGLTLAAARGEGFEADAVLVVQHDHAHFYPTQELIYLQVVVDRKTRRLLGAQGVSGNGDALTGRINSIAALLMHRGLIEDLSNLEMAYSPPFGGALDIVNTAANAAENLVEGYNRSITVNEFEGLFLEGQDNVACLDVRGPAMAQPLISRFGERWLNIPQETLRRRFDEVPKDKRLILICNAGMRSYEALRQLQSQGFDNAVGLQGGIAGLKKAGILDLD
jgi:NADPH-dependent 2,4-dienoyl-CoA reductase/sulfur reductase-like enzyme/rhodanese-related sulfurtransferase